MKRFSIPALALVMALILSACGQAAPPTLSAVDMQSTAASVALTMFAGTQAAIPTATPVPPTETPTNTPAPTNTFLPLDTPGATFTPSGNSGGGEACTETTEMPKVLHGEQVKIRINNSTKVKLALSVYLNQSTPGGQCGYRTYTVDAGGGLVINDLVEGCYTVYAWNPDPEGYFIVTNGTNCLDASYPWAFDISTRDIKVR